MTDRVLIVDPQRLLPQALDDLFTARGYDAERCSDGREAMLRLAANHYPVVFVAINESSSLSLIGQLRAAVRQPAEIYAVGPDKVPMAVQALQSGARHYWAEPLDLQQVELKLNEGKVRTQPSNPRYQREGTLLQVIKEIALTMELDGLVNILMDSAMELAGADAGAMLLSLTDFRLK